MMSFLKKLGSALFNFLEIEVGLAPIASQLIPQGSPVAQSIKTYVDDFTLLAQQALTIEVALQGAPGADKLKALIPLIGNVVKSSEVVSGKKIANETLFTQAVQEYAQATVDLLNSLQG